MHDWACLLYDERDGPVLMWFGGGLGCFNGPAVTRSGNVGSIAMFLTPVFNLIIHKMLVNIHALDI